MIGTMRDAFAEVKRVRDEWAGHLSWLEQQGHGASDLAEAIRAYVLAADKLVAQAPLSDRP
jgi:hypothetical protein